MHAESKSEYGWGIWFTTAFLRANGGKAGRKMLPVCSSERIFQLWVKVKMHHTEYEPGNERSSNTAAYGWTKGHTTLLTFILGHGFHHILLSSIFHASSICLLSEEKQNWINIYLYDGGGEAALNTTHMLRKDIALLEVKFEKVVKADIFIWWTTKGLI